MRQLKNGMIGRLRAMVAADAEAAKDRAAYVDRWLVPPDLETKDLETYLPSDLIGHAGVDLRTDAQLRALEQWKLRYAAVFDELRADPSINTRELGRGCIQNGYYATPDAEIYAAMILDCGPRKIVEVGSGFSTRIARRTAARLSAPCTITAVDPAPRADVTAVADQIVAAPVEQTPPDALDIDRDTLLFIDSSHITRARGDVTYLYNVVLPALPAGVLVHVHDVFIPYDYPFRYQERLYTEQYVLQALLAHSPRYQVLFATHYMSRNHTAAMQEVFGRVVGSDEYAGASFWFTVAG